MSSRSFLATHFQPIDARRAFPCFDEPTYKATFDISVNHEIKYTAISNMPVQSRTVENDTATTVFQKSPKMSTYLVAIVVSEFVQITNDAKNVSIWARPDAIGGGNYSLDIIEREFRLMLQYTGIPYEIGKLDNAAIPNFFEGAMENWGLITYQ